MLKKETTTIGEYQYEATQLPAPQGIALLEWLLKKLGPGIEVMFKDAGPVEKGDELVNQIGLLLGIGAILKNLSGQDFQYLYGELAPSCTANGVGMDKQESRTLHFAGDYGRFMQWIIWMLQVNYRSFFAGLGTLQQVASAQGFPTQSVSESQKG